MALKRGASKLENKQSGLEKGLYELAMALADLERAEAVLEAV